MFEPCEPGAGGDGCAFHVPDNFGAGQSDVDQIDLCKRYWFFQRADSQFFANVVGVIAKHGFPCQVESAGRVLKFDADLATGNTIGGAGRCRRIRDVFERRLADHFEIRGAQHSTFFWHEFEGAAGERKRLVRKMIRDALPREFVILNVVSNSDGFVAQRQVTVSLGRLNRARAHEG